MGVLIFLNIILIALLIFLLVYLFKNGGKKDITKDVSENSSGYCKNKISDSDVNKILFTSNSDVNKKIKLERVFDGRFVSDEEYQQIIKNKISNISISFEEVEHEYEHLKELINEGTKGNSER